MESPTIQANAFSYNNSWLWTADPAVTIDGFSMTSHHNNVLPAVVAHCFTDLSRIQIYIIFYCHIHN